MVGALAKETQQFVFVADPGAYNGKRIFRVRLGCLLDAPVVDAELGGATGRGSGVVDVRRGGCGIGDYVVHGHHARQGPGAVAGHLWLDAAEGLSTGATISGQVSGQPAGIGHARTARKNPCTQPGGTYVTIAEYYELCLSAPNEAKVCVGCTRPVLDRRTLLCPWCGSYRFECVAKAVEFVAQWWLEHPHIDFWAGWLEFELPDFDALIDDDEDEEFEIIFENDDYENTDVPEGSEDGLEEA